MSTPVKTSSPTASSPASLKALVLPREHGSWSLALEPVALGLLVAPSPGGAWLALAVVAGFFTRRPLKLAWTLPSSDPRRAPAARWTALFGTLALAGLLLAGTGDSPLSALWPLLLAAPLAAAFLWFDLRNEMREAEAELAGSAAFALVPAAFATLAGWTAGPALALAALMLARSMPTVLAVRAYLRIQKGRAAAAGAAWATAALALGVTGLLAWRGLVPAAAVAIVGLFFARTAGLLGPARPTWSARRIGMLEAVLGVIFLTGLVLAYRGT